MSEYNICAGLSMGKNIATFFFWGVLGTCPLTGQMLFYLTTPPALNSSTFMPVATSSLLCCELPGLAYTSFVSLAV
jgi:hypothetical protein